MVQIECNVNAKECMIEPSVDLPHTYIMTSNKLYFT